ncbi:hypothetical protein KAR52_00565 [Candidatus Pacearchaeota archaeon]|nr:hypothetical protein [Candidatus Pacearchaeota archaeon]
MKKQIVFVEASPNIVGFKRARALKEKGYEIVLISFLKFNKDFYKSAYDKIIDLNLDSFSINIKNGINLIKKSPQILRKIFEIKKLNPYVVIGTAAPYPLWLPALTRKIIKNIPFIFFPYDVNALKYRKKEDYKKAGIPIFELKAEKYLFENSDGIIFKGGEYEFVKKKIKIKCPVISFPPYCSKEFVVPINKNKLSKKDKEIHLVYVGSMGSLASSDLESDKDSISTILLKQKMHLHIYSGQYNSIKHSKKYKALLKNRYFHLHKPLGPTEIVKEISKYDFGYSFPMYDLKILNKEIVTTCTSNKMASYLEAGIPLIYWSSLLEYQDKILKKYKINLGVSKKDLNNLRLKLKKINYKKLEKKVIGAREDYNIEKNLPRLEDFFEKCIKSKNSNNYL